MTRIKLICALYFAISSSIFIYVPAFAQPSGSAASADSAAIVDKAMVEAVLTKALGAEVASSVDKRIAAFPERFAQLAQAVAAQYAQDPMLFFPVDKKRALSASFVPGDLVKIESKASNRPGQELRRTASAHLSEMIKAAQKEGAQLIVGSAYRSFAYQIGVWDRSVAQIGKESTSMLVALPGHSQHQLGTAVDFSPIDDVFAKSPGSLWLARNAWKFGFSQSYPQGKTDITGYAWESWHWRYVGLEAAALQREYFGDMQAYCLAFIDAWCKK